jgi:signal peptidase
MFDFSFLDEFKRMNKRQVYYQVLNFAMIVSTALMIWKGLMVVTGSESPIVVVLRLFSTPNINNLINNE